MADPGKQPVSQPGFDLQAAGFSGEDLGRIFVANPARTYSFVTGA